MGSVHDQRSAQARARDAKRAINKAAQIRKVGKVLAKPGRGEIFDDYEKRIREREKPNG